MYERIIQYNKFAHNEFDFSLDLLISLLLILSICNFLSYSDQLYRPISICL